MGGTKKRTQPGSTPPFERPGDVAPTPDADCPERLEAVVSGPDRGFSRGMYLDVVLDESSGAPRVLTRDAVDGRTLGAIGGIPDLSRLIRCLRAGAVYRAVVNAVDGGRTEISVLRV